jgi:hypothetical protein
MWHTHALGMVPGITVITSYCPLVCSARLSADTTWEFYLWTWIRVTVSGHLNLADGQVPKSEFFAILEGKHAKDNQASG